MDPIGERATQAARSAIRCSSFIKITGLAKHKDIVGTDISSDERLEMNIRATEPLLRRTSVRSEDD